MRAGGTGDMGQRIRDEILDIQRRNNAMGGFMEVRCRLLSVERTAAFSASFLTRVLPLCAVARLQEWHQKLHNNTTPDDVAICEGLLAYMAAGLDVKGAKLCIRKPPCLHAL
jgi:alpha-glucan,water dikinase